MQSSCLSSDRFHGLANVCTWTFCGILLSTCWSQSYHKFKASLVEAVLSFTLMWVPGIRRLHQALLVSVFIHWVIDPTLVSFRKQAASLSRLELRIFLSPEQLELQMRFTAVISVIRCFKRKWGSLERNELELTRVGDIGLRGRITQHWLM